ncbi:MAG: NYN domain-containing protein [Pseudomonadota bacterium]
MATCYKVGVFVDAENVRYNGGYQMRYDVLRRFAARGERSLVRLNTYVAFDPERAGEDPEYARRAYGFQQAARQYGWKVNVKNARHFTDSDGNTITKANADIDIAVDALQQADNLDEILLVSGDGDFCPLVAALQSRGCRAELVGFDNVSRSLQRQVDFFHSGFLIPDLVSISYEPRNQWGETGSCVRGLCTKWFSDKGYGFLSFLRQIDDNIWLTDSRVPESPWSSVFCHINEVASEVTEENLLKGDTVLEFYLKESPQEEGGLVAQNVRLIQK